MEQIIRQSYGIDISKLDFSVCLASLLPSGICLFGKVEKFSNNRNGFNQLLKWSRKMGDSTLPSCFVMEATGIYYEALAYHLHKLKKPVSVLLPNKVKHFAKSLNISTKTDAVDARIISRLGVERQLQTWTPPAPVFKKLRDLTRLNSDLKQKCTVFKNRNERISYGVNVHPFIKKTNAKLLNELKKQIDKCEKEILKLIKSEPWLLEKVEKLSTIKGVGFVAITTVISETQGFALIKNRKKLASYAGYDVVEKESGTSVKGRTRISKKGNSRIRACLHFPALVASRYNQELKQDYLRIIANKPSKMIGITALQRKLLLLMYTLWKKDEIYLEPELRISGNKETKSLLCQD